LFVVPFQDMQGAIRDHCNEENRVVLYRRMMYRIAGEIACRYSFMALVTGESLGQVASQTLENLAAVSCVTSLSVFRPLIGMNKESIISRAKSPNRIVVRFSCLKIPLPGVRYLSWKGMRKKSPGKNCAMTLWPRWKSSRLMTYEVDDIFMT